MLHIEQQKTAERVNADIITSLYNKAIINENHTYLKGYIRTSYAYKDEVDYLKQNIDLDIDIIEDYYLRFEDPYCAAFWANTIIGDGIGTPINNVTLLTSGNSNNSAEYSVYHNNNIFGRDADTHPVSEEQYNRLTQIKKFNELQYFINIKQSNWHNPVFRWLTNLEEVTLGPNWTSVSFSNNTKLKKADLTLCGDTLTNLDYPNRSLLDIIVYPPLIHTPQHGSNADSMIATDIFLYTLTPLQDESHTSTWACTSKTCNIWVQDSAYDLWLTNKWGAAHSSQIKRFSEYTGDDLITAWVENTNAGF